MNEFKKIVQDIKDLKIQGATNIALQGLKAMQIHSDYKSIKELMKLLDEKQYDEVWIIGGNIIYKQFLYMPDFEEL